jgi:hypothetical protein
MILNQLKKQLQEAKSQEEIRNKTQAYDQYVSSFTAPGSSERNNNHEVLFSAFQIPLIPLLVCILELGKSQRFFHSYHSPSIAGSFFIFVHTRHTRERQRKQISSEG